MMKRRNGRNNIDYSWNFNNIYIISHWIPFTFMLLFLFILLLMFIFSLIIKK